MHRSVAAVAVIALFALAGCAATEVKTTDAVCAAVTSWDEFEDFAGTPGRDDAEMLAKRDAMVEQWTAAADDAPTWAAGTLKLAAGWMDDFAASATSDEAVGYHRGVSAQIELLRAQCVEDGNL